MKEGKVKSIKILRERYNLLVSEKILKIYQNIYFPKYFKSFINKKSTLKSLDCTYIFIDFFTITIKYTWISIDFKINGAESRSSRLEINEFDVENNW